MPTSLRSASFLAVLASACVLLLLPGCSDDGPDPSEAPRTNASTMGQTEVKRLDEPEPVRAMPVTTLSDSTFTLGAEGTVTVVNFWATWCGPCRKEIPDLIALQDSMASEGVTVVGVSMDKGDASIVRDFVADNAMDYPVVLDGANDIEAELGPIYGLPTTVVIGPNGEITHRILGLFPVADMKPDLRALLSAS